MVTTLKDLEKLIKLCRKHGISNIKHEGLEIHLGDAPLVTSSKEILKNTQTYAPGGITADTKIITDELSSNDLLFWSVEDPFENEQA